MINEGGQELLKWNHSMNFRFISEMILYTVFTLMYVAHTTVQWGLGITAQNTSNSVLGAISKVNGQEESLASGMELFYNSWKCMQQVILVVYEYPRKLHMYHFRQILFFFQPKSSQSNMEGSELFTVPGLITCVISRVFF